MCAASVVVVALAGATERSAGQNNYLNPMALGKLVIVTDGTGVDEYVEHRRTALVVPAGDDESLAREIAWALDPANAEEVAGIAAPRRGITCSSGSVPMLTSIACSRWLRRR